MIAKLTASKKHGSSSLHATVRGRHRISLTQSKHASVDRHGEVGARHLNGGKAVLHVVDGNHAGRAESDGLVTAEAHEWVRTGNLVGDDLALSRSRYK